MTTLIEALDTAGFAIVEDALDAETLATLASTAQAALTNETGGTRHATIERPSAIANHPDVAAAARHVGGGDYQCVASSVRDPLPGHGQQGLHTDWHPRTSHRAPFVGISCLWLIDAFTATNGATRVVPGSHRQGRPIPKSYVAPQAHHEDEQLLIAPAGSLIVFNCHLWHSGTENRSNSQRRVLQEQYIVAHLASMYTPKHRHD